MQTDSKLVRQTATELIESGKEILVVLHSYGGIVGTNSLYGLGVQQRKQEGKEGGIRCLAYMCAFMPVKGESLYGTWGLSDVSQGPPFVTAKVCLLVRLICWTMLNRSQDGMLHLQDANTTFYNDLRPEVRQRWVEQLVLHPVDAQVTPGKADVENEAWRDIDSGYLLCEQDMAIPLEHQRMMAERAKNQGSNVMMKTCSAGHSPFLSMPDTVVEWIEELAEVGGK